MCFIKEKCRHCSNNINVGQSVIECESCNIIFHSKCLKVSETFDENVIWACESCKINIVQKYNPFKNWLGPEADIDRENDIECGHDAVSVSQILENCKSYTIKTLNKTLLTPDIAKDISENNVASSLFLNIDGNLTNFDHMLAIIKGIKHNFKAIGLAETNTGPNTCSPYCIPNYTPYYQDTREGKQSGTGVALYIHNSLNGIVIPEVSHCTTHIESLFVKITNTEQPLYFGVVYRPNDGDKSLFYDELEHIFDFLPDKGTFLMGDFNINLFNKVPDSDYEETIYSSGFAPLISIATHIRSNSKPSCIDNIISNEAKNTIFTGTLSDNITHHLPIFQFSQIKCPREVIEKHTQYYDFRNTNIHSFVKELGPAITNIRPSTNFSDFTDLFTCTLDKHYKLNKPKTTKRTFQNNPWITEGIIDAIQRKHELKKIWTKSITKSYPLGNPQLRDKFKKYRRVLTQIISRAKKKHLSKKFAECKDDRKKTWGIINEIRGNSKKSLKPSFIIDKKRVTDRRIIANSFNKYFTSIASKLNGNIISDVSLKEHTLPSFLQYMSPSNPCSLVMFECESQEVNQIISELQNGKSSDIPIKVIKRSSNVISPILAKYYNIMMEAGIFPDVCKTAKVTPIFKKDDAELLENYRPISTLPIFGKIFEKVIYSRLYSFFTSKGLLCDNQFGFRKSHSTSHAVNHSVTHIKNKLDSNEYVLGIFIDLSKAFDTIDHKNLIDKLHHYGVRGKSNKLIESYLANRHQYTECLGEKSDSLEITYGVPQGSVLGPLLFLIYINDLINCSNKGEFVLFADDTNIFVSSKSLPEAFTKANNLLSSLNRYMTLNKLHINLAKCSYIIFKPKSKEVDQPYPFLELKINDVVIKQVKFTKFLGVTIDENLNWEQHVKSLKRKLYYSMSTLSQLRKNIPEHLHKEIYYTLFESHICYALSVYGGASQSILTQIHKLQKRALHILFGDIEAYKDKFKTAARTRPLGNQVLGTSFYVREHTKPIFKKHGILAVQNLYFMQCFMETFKILKFRLPTSLLAHYSFSNRKYLTYIKLIPPKPNNQFIYKSSIIWNTIRSQLDFNDLSISSDVAKNRLRSALHRNQHLYHDTEWLGSLDFNIGKLRQSTFVN